MIVLGRKYKFTKFEKLRLRKKFKKRLIIKYSNREPLEVLEELKILIEKTDINLIVLNTKAKVPDELVKYLTNLQFDKNIKLVTIEQFVENYLYKCYIPDDHSDLNYLQNIKPFNLFQYTVKRIIDFIGVLLILFFSFPIIVYSIKRIKKESPGSIFFKQERVGIRGKLFYCYKFRSMHENSVHDPYTRENDPRIFSYGNLMRETRIDEIPQILNVLKGDMHLIGPRAEWNILVEDYEKELPYYNERHLIRPGITGWAQVMYQYGSGTYDAKQKLMYDLYYIKHYSLWLDIKIVWKTILVILGKRGL